MVLTRSRTTLTVAMVLQGLQVGGMERCAIQLATSAIGAGYDARLILYDVPPRRSGAEYDPGNVPVAFVSRRHGIDITLPVRLARIFQSWNVDIVHARNNVAGFYSAAALGLIQDPPPLILTFDTFPGHGTAKARLASRWASQCAAIVSSVSSDLSDRLVRSGWVNRCETVWNGVDTGAFNPDGPLHGFKKRFGFPQHTLVIGNVARLDENKRQLDLIEAFSRLTRENSGIALAIAGDGPNRERVVKAASSVRNVLMLGRIYDVAAFLREIDTFVLCSEDEGCPRALLEAMACRKPIIATAVGGIPHILAGCGLLVPPRRPDMLADAINVMCSSREVREQFGQLARARILDSFTLEQEWCHYERMYESVIQLPTNSLTVGRLARPD